MTIFLWLLALITVFAGGYFAYRADKKRAVPHAWLTAALRALVLALVWALILAPSIHVSKTEIEKPVLVFLQDESSSIPTALKGDTSTYNVTARKLVQDLSEHYRVVQWGFGNNTKTDSFFQYTQTATDIAAPLARVQEFFGSQNIGAVILASDGRFNQGMNPLFQTASIQAPVYTVSIGDTAVPKDIRISQVYFNRAVMKDAQFVVRADLIASACKGYNGVVQISEGTNVLGSNALSITSDRFDKSIGFTLKADKAGLHHYVISAPAAEGEQNTANNRKDVFVEVVDEKKKILIVAAAPHPDIAAIREALSSTDAYTVSVQNRIPENLGGFDVLILHGMAPDDAMPGFSRKAVWYIAASGTGPFNSSVAANNPINTAAPHDVYAAANPAFTAFNPPAGLASVLDRLPPLSSSHGIISPGAGVQALFYQKGSTNPLWLLKAGTPPQALLLGEGLWRWRLYEYRYFHKHEVVDECIRQTVALLAANVSDAPFRVNLPKYEWSEGEHISLDAYLLNAAGEQINTPEATLTITDSAGHKQEYRFEKNGSAYRLNLGQMPGGTYKYVAGTNFNGNRRSVTGSFVVTTVPLEAIESGADFPLMYGLGRMYGGSAIRSQQMASLYDTITRNENIRPIVRSRDTTVPLVDWKWYFFLILLVATAEWLLRKYWLAQ